MPAKYNWAIIRNGETFQSLVNTLILFEKPGARVFGRSGRDAAQDARSMDGKCVYQCKFHDHPTISKTINDALRELAKIKTYRQPSDSRYSLWQNANEWVLVTNVALNPGDAARWDSEVVPEFKLAGLDAKLWGLEQLDALLTKHPHVTEAYFEGKNRCFLSLEEAVAYAEADEIGAAGLQVGLEGREAEMSAITAFLQGSKSLLCFHGPGGIGKSRLLLEIGQWAQREGFQVLSANEATMSQSDTWFASVPFTEKTLLLVDEPQDPRLVRLMAEQLRAPSSQMKSWKVLIAVRSPKDPVMKAVVDMPPDLRATAVSLPPLSAAAARQLAQNLIAKSPSLASLSDGRKAEMALHLAKLGNQYPIWIAMAVSVLSKHGHLASLPTTVEEIAAKYLAEVIEHSSERIATKQQTQELLRWLAVYEEVNADDTATIAFITKQAGFSSEAVFDECLNSLVARKFVVRRGINGRLFAIKPDLMREFVLRTWLTRPGEAGIETTTAAKALVKLLVEGQNNKPIPRNQQIIRSLAKAELAERFQGRALDLLSPLVAEVKTLAKDGTVLQQQAMIGLVGSFAFARIPDLL
ncbi:MAG: hypothetical protein JWQ04_1218, partial [Pedosphaera sp.]|nr:hypothetical protein [Pedosphaera sp.]